MIYQLPLIRTKEYNATRIALKIYL